MRAREWLAERGFKSTTDRDLIVRYDTLVAMFETFETHTLREVRDALREIEESNTFNFNTREEHCDYEAAFKELEGEFDKGGLFEIKEGEA